MSRFMRVAVVVTGLGLVVARAGEQSERKTLEGRPMLKAVVHVNFADVERQGHGLKNVANILKDVGDDGAAIEVVCHGAGIALLVEDKSGHAEQVGALRGRGVRFVACENTMREKSIAREGLLPGVATVPSGAVEVLRKQQDGYGYFRP